MTTVQSVRISNDYGSTTTAGDDGRFRLPRLRAGKVNLTVTAKGHSPEVQRVTVAERMDEVEVLLEPGRLLRARVVDPAGKPIANATVRVESWRSGEALGWQSKTDAGGWFEMADAPADGASFAVSAEDVEGKVREVLRAK